MNTKKWDILYRSRVSSIEYLVSVLLKNRGIKTKKDRDGFFNPPNPSNTSISSLGIKKTDLKRAIDRIKKAKADKEQVIIYGDYDADGITATAIMWEALHDYGLDVLPHIPDRFEEGYGINTQSVENLKSKIPNLKLIITVDNGIVAYEGVDKAKELGIDVIVIDHHTLGTKKNTALAVVHSTQTSGSGLSWFFVKELFSSIKYPVSNILQSLELAAIGTIADQLPLTGVNRSIVKYGLSELNKTKRPGLLALFKESGIEKDNGQSVSIGTYEVGYIIAPRINAMGRLKHGIESLRLLCTKDKLKAFDIAQNIGNTNIDRQKMVDSVMATTLSELKNESKGPTNKIIVISGENYHEGVIGLAAGRLVEEYYRPAIVLSVKGDIAKASARSISGFDIISAIRNSSDLILQGGGHPMAAGFSISTNKIEEFTKAINAYAGEQLTDELLQKKLKIDCEINFDQINYDLYNKLTEFDPTGLGNFTPLFCTREVRVVGVKSVGRENKHLKMKLEKGGANFDAIWFNANLSISLAAHQVIDVVYNIDDNSWNGYKNLQLKIKDMEMV